MKNMKKTLLSLSLLILVATAGLAETPQPGLDGMAAVNEGTQNSPDIKRMQAEVETASWKRLEASSPQLPHLTASYTQVLATKYSYLGVHFGGAAVEFPSAMPSSILDFSASIMLFDALETWHNCLAADFAYQAAKADLSRAQFQLEQIIQLRFYQALAAQELLEVTNQNIRTLEEHLAIANVSQRSGVSTRFNVLRIEAQLEEARAEKNLAEDNAQLARKNLALAMGSDDDSRSLQGALLVPGTIVLPATLKPNFQERDDIKAQLDREGAAKAFAQAFASIWWPKLFVYADQEYYKYKAFDPAIIETDEFKPAYTVGARLTWNLFDGGASLARQQTAGHRAEEAVQASRALLLKAGNDFELWKRRLTYNTGLYRARLRTEEKSKESVRLATLGLKAGTNTNSEVLDAELDLFRSRAGIIRAQLDAAEAQINLELAIGEKLSEASAAKL